MGSGSGIRQIEFPVAEQEGAWDLTIILPSAPPALGPEIKRGFIDGLCANARPRRGIEALTSLVHDPGLVSRTRF